MSSLPQVRVLTLNQDENNQYKLYRLEKGWILRFVLGPSLMASNVRLFCNHPDNMNSPYDRKKFYEVQWRTVTGNKSDRTEMTADVKMIIPGSFNYYFTIDNLEKLASCNGSGYFLVDPTLMVGDEEIRMDAIVCQSVITKLLGPFSEWTPRLQVAYESGYNMIHFTPVQELGISNSAYSIKDQLKFSPVYSRGQSKQLDYTDLEKLVEHMNKHWRVLSLSDLVYNHTAKDSPWIWKHPECAFNLKNTPHLRPAYIMDRILEHFSLEVSKGLWEKDGIPASVNSEYHLSAIGHVLHHKVFPLHRIHEFYCIGVDNIIKDFKKAIETSSGTGDNSATELTIVQDPEYRRFKSSIDMNLALKLYNTDRPGVFSRADRITKCCEALTDRLVHLNVTKENEIRDHINCAIGNFIANVRWRYINPAGPKFSRVTEEEPLMNGYFIIPKSHEGSVDKEEKMSYDEPSQIMACNGWVMGDDPLRNFAEPGGRLVYLRRELVGWGDSVKLNFGKSPSDCPYLWQLMEEYTKISARIFQGLRLDNCHSTPIHVAEHMLDVARRVRPNLYVIAELFTGSEHLDNLFMNRLGINSLIREALVAHDSHDQGRLVHRFGGDPVGAFIQPRIKPLVPCMAHALFYDQTHDNECPIDKRSAWDLWPTAGMVAISNCAIGSNRGYDQMVPIHINVVKEERLYTSWSPLPNPDAPFINQTFGITAGKRALNHLHYWLAREGYSQVYVDQVDVNTVSITRHKPQSHESVVLIARTAFSNPTNPVEQGFIRNIIVQGKIDEIVLEGQLQRAAQFMYKTNTDFINGLPDYYLDLREHFPVYESNVIRISSLENGHATEISFLNLTPGTVVAVKCSLPENAKGAILEIRRGLGQFGYMMRSYSGNTMFGDTDGSNFRMIVSKLTFADLNRCLYRIDQEERDDCYGIGAYNVPNSGALVYCGLKGLMSLLNVIRSHNDLGHPLCGNLRDGNWLPDYIVNRLKVHSSFTNLADWFDSIFKHLAMMPRYLIPCYFDAIVTGADIVLSETAKDLMSDFVKDGSNFVKILSLTAFQFVGYTCQARLPLLSPKLLPPPRQEFNNKSKQLEEATLSMSAGFPHFGGGYMRNWGRDTFVSLRGLLLVTGQDELARHIILAYAGTLRHGLIPNLLNEGTGARYNARDAVWYWLTAIRDYCEQVKDGYNILKDPVSRLYPTDDSRPLEAGVHEQPLYEVMQEALVRHAYGVQFRERNAGPQIDDQMTDPGFDVHIGIDWNTGFVFGGNEHNCGTWMDKMGSSAKAGNKGKPATPRDGSAVELVGMCAGVVKWLTEANKKKLYPYDGVVCHNNDKKDTITFTAWYDKMKANFEQCFFIAEQPDTDNEPRPDLINRRGIYKDTLNATHCWTDYQLRCNFPIAMMACPDLFTPAKAWAALTMVEKILLGPLGMKTLDPSDYAYRGDYFNDNDSTDMHIANGWNYHQGPEWVWPVGFFLRAKLYFASKLESKKPGILNQTKLYINSVLCKHYEEILTNPWQGLPELTNSNGQYCPGSCRTQAWSSATILETLHDMAKMEELGL